VSEAKVEHRSGPERALGPLAALALVVGSMLGIGIFISPPEVAVHVTGSGPFMALWLFGGVSALLGALCLAELGAMLPRSGGDYTYMHGSWGPGIAFAAGWLQLLAIYPGSLASVAVAVCAYQFPVLFGPGVAEPLYVLGVEIPGSHVWATVLIIALTAINHLGVKISGAVQVLVTSIPMVVLLFVTFWVLGQPQAAVEPSAAPVEHEPAAIDLARAFLPVYFAYSGWNAAIYVGGEIRNPGRNLPLSLVGGTALVTAFYLILCWGFLDVFSLEGLAHAGEAGTAAAQAMFGPTGVLIMAVLIALSMLGSLNGSVLTGSRIAYAMAEQGDCPPTAAQLHPRFSTPVVALWMQCGLSLILLYADLWIFGKGVDSLIAYTSSAMLITGTLTVLAVVIYRRREPHLPRPYKTWLYPLPPLVHAIASLVVLVVLARQGDPSVWIAVFWFAGALLYHRFFRAPSPVPTPASVPAADPPSGPC
jgi:APA family basic amino acid/polyamine antiporter